MFHFLEVTRGCPFNCIFCGAGVTQNDVTSNVKTWSFDPPPRRRWYQGVCKSDSFGWYFLCHGVYPATERYFMRSRNSSGMKDSLCERISSLRLPLSKKFVQDFIQTYSVKNQLFGLASGISQNLSGKNWRLIGKFDNAFASQISNWVLFLIMQAASYGLCYFMISEIPLKPCRITWKTSYCFQDRLVE